MAPAIFKVVQHVLDTAGAGGRCRGDPRADNCTTESAFMRCQSGSMDNPAQRNARILDMRSVRRIKDSTTDDFSLSKHDP